MVIVHNLFIYIRWMKFVYVLCVGYLDLVSPKHMLRAENNPWIKEIADQIVLGTSHILTYLRTTGENGYER